MLSWQIPAACATLTDFVPFVKAGKCRLLASSGPTRSRFFPETPTFIEQGFPGIESRDKFGVYLPAGTSPQKAELLSKLIQSAVARSDVRRTLEDNALERVMNLLR
ncbi:tripartite tricarboxylate transporter substrate-binding protein [Achromobacter denitrificans]|uniref:tripartite tricarboxylate transporter substrate-binding protein n=1 Tax=Achromobacter denitrificans TaxID=32002 RepID=UPI000F4D953B|nr:hypothetical protein EC609_19660 [Achromobacter denitrificans]